MTKIIQFILLVIMLATFSSVAIANVSFYDEAIKMYKEKNMMMQSSYLKEILFTTLKMLSHTCI